MVLLEELKDKVRPDIKSHLDEQKVEELENAAFKANKLWALWKTWPYNYNCWKLGGKTPFEHCGRFNHKSEDCKIAKNKLQKEVKLTGITSLKGLKVSPLNDSENLKGEKVKRLIDWNNFVEKKKA